MKMKKNNSRKGKGRSQRRAEEAKKQNKEAEENKKKNMN